MKRFAALVFLLSVCFAEPEPYSKTPNGVFIGKIPDENNVGINGDLYVVNETHFMVDNCTYTYYAPDMFFYADKSEKITETGLLIPTQEFGDKPIKRYENAKVLLKLPEGRKVTEFKSFGFWCRQFTVNFGTVTIDQGRLKF